MDALIYIAMSGADRMLKAQQIHANNIANAETGGFRADIGVSTSQAVPGYGYDARHLSQNGANAVDVRSGAVVQTGRDLDVAVQGDGFLTLQGPDGKEVYTRAGNMVADVDGKLSVNGHPVLGDGGQITVPPDYVKLHIGSDGVISVLAAGESEMQPIDKLAGQAAAAGHRQGRQRPGDQPPGRRAGRRRYRQGAGRAPGAQQCVGGGRNGGHHDAEPQL